MHDMYKHADALLKEIRRIKQSTGRVDTYSDVILAYLTSEMKKI